MKIDSLDYCIIDGYNNKYCITRDGKVYRRTSDDDWKEMKPRIIAGYYALGLEKPASERKGKREQKINKIHRLIAEYFIPNPENKPCINHINGNKLDNRIENLEWCTVQENTRHAYANKLERNWWNKELGIICINLIENYKYNFADVARLFDIPRQRVSWFWYNGHKTFELKHNNPFIPKHSKKKTVPEAYRTYIQEVLKVNTVLNKETKKSLQCND